METDYLIVGLGNPGSKYEKTRHNLGFMVVEALAKKHRLSFKRGWRFSGRVASGVIDGQKVHLLMPTTYMNLSGTAIARAMHIYKVAPPHLVVVVDDVYVEFGAMRFRAEGGTGGHNGLKSIQTCLGTQAYSRLRMGIGQKNVENLPQGLEGQLEEYVLANFTPSELQVLPQFLESGALVVEAWISRGVEGANSQTNAQPKGKE